MTERTPRCLISPVGPQLGRHRQCGLAICTFHLGFSLVRLSYALMRIAAHHLIHAGEIVTVRSCLGHDTDKLGRPDWGRPLA